MFQKVKTSCTLPPNVAKLSLNTLLKKSQVYPPKESSLKNLSEGSIWFECSLYLILSPKGEFLKEPPRGVPFGLSALFHYVIGQILVSFPLGTRRTYCVVGGGGGGWGVFCRITKKLPFF